MDVLKLAENGIKKTKIMHKARLSYSQLEQYLNALKRADFIAEESGVWKTTEKGFHVIEACEICHSLMKNGYGKKLSHKSSYS
jgi:predicted transcriptional regulator